MRDAELIEATLLALGERGIEIRHALYPRFFAACPDRVEAFLCPDATSRRMTDETLQMLYGLAAGEDWVWTQIAELVETHRNYGRLRVDEYDVFVDLVVAEVGRAVPDLWDGATAAAWRDQAVTLKSMIARAQADWDRILPQTQFG